MSCSSNHIYIFINCNICNITSHSLYDDIVYISDGSFAINRRFVFAITSLGGHSSTAKNICGDLDLPPPVHTYAEHLATIEKAASNEARSSMLQAVNEAKDSVKCSDISVSVDGTWQKRGFSSKNGVVTCLSNLGKHKANKVVDTDILTTYCATCTQMNNERTKLSKVARGHVCKVNHEGSSGLMEVRGAMGIFGRSEATRNCRYTSYLGDGDSKTFSVVAKSNVYGEDVQIRKLECTGHVQKRMGKALMNLVEVYKGKTFVIDKEGRKLTKVKAEENNGEKLIRGIGGMNKLTKKAIKSIQGHYGAAIRENNSVAAMKNAIMAIWSHRSGDHTNCSEWCPMVKSGDINAANKHQLPNYICNMMLPTFEKLSSNDLLSRCVHGGTQNANESYHHVLWNKCPKEKFVGKTRLSLAVADSTVLFNDGEIGRLNIYKRLGLKVGKFQHRHAISADKLRVEKAQRAVLPVTKSHRKTVTINKQPADNSYSAGAF